MSNRPTIPTPDSRLHTSFNPAIGTLAGGTRSERRLSALSGIWLDEGAFRTLVDAGDPLVYSVETMEPAHGEGGLHYGIGRIEPGKVGEEYFMTRGHLHDWRPAAEVYIGLSGEGTMLLESEVTGESRLLRLNGNDVVYVPGFTAHRTINTGSVPLVYMGIYAAMAGHDYSTIAERNFTCVVVDVQGVPTLVDRADYRGK